ncbi:MAG TPA: chromate efflux transporter [Longimicrobiales bacterium]|nr:chromate efflux transporter [Longimicrobiales bacterium]
MNERALAAVSRREALGVWVKVALHSFGGPAGQIAVIHRVVVDEKQWLSERRFLHAMSYCMLLPGPEAQQLATYIGWLLHGVRGGLIAGGLFILPGFVSILVLSVLYAGYRDVGMVEGLFFGLKPAVLAVVIEALVRLRRRALSGTVDVAIAAGAFMAIFVFGVPFPLVVAGAALGGLAAHRSGSTATAGNGMRAGSAIPLPSLLATGRTAVVWLAIWLVPLIALLAALGSQHVFVREGVFFSKAAVVTFGGAYAVLAYVAQQAVETYQWLGPGEMLDGLGMAETTPGPLIQVVQFVGFMGGYRHAAGLHPMLAGVVGSIVTTWVTFAPCFLFIFVGAPFVEYLRENRWLNAALRGITAAVVGVVLNLAVWFALHTLFGEVQTVEYGVVRTSVPQLATLDWRALIIAVGAMVAMFRFRIGMMATLGAAAIVGIVLRAAG